MSMRCATAHIPAAVQLPAPAPSAVLSLLPPVCDPVHPDQLHPCYHQLLGPGLVSMVLPLTDLLLLPLPYAWVR